MILRKTQSLIVDDLKPEPSSEREIGQKSEDDICTPKAEPPNEDDRPLA